jgi:glycine cleavage system aminomethyltransferase T
MALSWKNITVARTNCGADVFGLACFLRDDDLICHDGLFGRMDLTARHFKNIGISRVLAGFTLPDRNAPCPKENHLVIEGGDIVGRVTSAVLSPTLNKVIGLTYLPVSRSAAGSRFQIRIDGGRMVDAEVVPTPFYDPDNKRQEM